MDLLTPFQQLQLGDMEFVDYLPDARVLPKASGGAARGKPTTSVAGTAAKAPPMKQPTSMPEAKKLPKSYRDYLRRMPSGVEAAFDVAGYSGWSEAQLDKELVALLNEKLEKNGGFLSEKDLPSGELHAVLNLVPKWGNDLLRFVRAHKKYFQRAEDWPGSAKPEEGHGGEVGLRDHFYKCFYVLCRRMRRIACAVESRTCDHEKSSAQTNFAFNFIEWRFYKRMVSPTPNAHRMCVWSPRGNNSWREFSSRHVLVFPRDSPTPCPLVVRSREEVGVRAGGHAPWRS